LQYDEELEALKHELNVFKKRNNINSQRTKSYHEQLLSVLNLDENENSNVVEESVVVQKKKKKKGKRGRKKLADPYEEEWNGLDPSNYAWFDDMVEGTCYDDRLMSLRDRRMQYLVVMAIENEYCTIVDLTDKQNELLLMHQRKWVY